MTATLTFEQTLNPKGEYKTLILRQLRGYVGTLQIGRTCLFSKLRFPQNCSHHSTMAAERQNRNSSWIEDVFVGAIAEGVNHSTLVLLNLAGIVLIIVLGFLAVVAQGYDLYLVLHVIVLLLFAVALLCLLNW